MRSYSNRDIAVREKSHVTSDDFAIRLLEIQTRIADLRSRFGWTEKSNKNTKTQPKYVVEPKESPNNTDTIQREQELQNLKAKLLGRK